MKKNKDHRNFSVYPKIPGIIFLFIPIWLFCVIFISGSSETAIQWNPWQNTLTSEKHPSGQALNLDIFFSGPGGSSFKVPAFTDDRKTWYLYTAFPSPGIWKWKTVCSDRDDKALHNRKGRVNVKPYKGENPIYKHGDLKISDDKRYLCYSDNTPFFWMGETGWNVALRSDMNEWQEYVDKRAEQGFTVLQIVPKGSSKIRDTTARGTTSFRNDGTPDPSYWLDLEAKVNYANRKGLFVFFTGTGGSWKKLFAENPVNQSFASYIAGRFAGHMVIFSPSMDQLYDPLNDAVAEELKSLTLHLVTQHPGTNYDANLKYRNSANVDFCGLQSGHHNGNLQKAYNAARSWTLDMWNGTPMKPVINIEAMYDAYGSDLAKNWRTKDSRKLGWIAWLSGSRGYTYGAGDVPPKVPKGAGGIWRFNKDTVAYDYWRKAMNWPSAGQMTIMSNFFRSVEWWKLAPSHELIRNQAEHDTLKMVSSMTKDGDLLLSYLTDNPEIILDLRSLSGSFKADWFNPVTGKSVSLDKPVIPGPDVVFKRPVGWEDALLVLTKN